MAEGWEVMGTGKFMMVMLLIIIAMFGGMDFILSNPIIIIFGLIIIAMIFMKK